MMRREALLQKKVWFDDFNEKINQMLDEFYAMVPDSGLSDREQYLYDTSQNQFKMLYELMDHSKDFINAELMLIGDAIETRQNADTKM